MSAIRASLSGACVALLITGCGVQRATPAPGGASGVGSGGTSSGGTGGSSSGGASGTGSGGTSGGDDASGGTGNGSGGTSGGTGGATTGVGGRGMGGMTAGGAGGSLAVEAKLITSGQGAYWQTATWTVVTSGTVDVTVNDSTAKQTFNGFGGTFNEAGWNVLSMLSAGDRARAIALLFDAQAGAHFLYGRIPIGAND